MKESLLNKSSYDCESISLFVGVPVCRVVLLVFGVFCFSVYGRPMRVSVPAESIVNEKAIGNMRMLFDEQDDETYPPGGSPATNWQVGWKAEDHPMHAFVDLGRVGELLTVYSSTAILIGVNP